jgi:hypothetical protein
VSCQCEGRGECQGAYGNAGMSRQRTDVNWFDSGGVLSVPTIDDAL